MRVYVAEQTIKDLQDKVITQFHLLRNSMADIIIRSHMKIHVWQEHFQYAFRLIPSHIISQVPV